MTEVDANERADDTSFEDLVERFFAQQTEGSSRDAEAYAREHPAHEGDLLEVLPILGPRDVHLLLGGMIRA